MTPLLLPTQSVYLPGQAILVEASHPGDLVVTHLGEAVREVRCASPGLVDLGELSDGGFGVAQPSTRASRAVQVCATASSPPSVRERTSRPWPVSRVAYT